MSWTGHETWLVACTLFSIALIVVLISVLKVHAFIALVLGAGFVGIASGLKALDVIKQFQSGFGSTLGSVRSARCSASCSRTPAAPIASCTRSWLGPGSDACRGRWR
jgi:hypothetical protein